jgi:hypothetical protein
MLKNDASHANPQITKNAPYESQTTHYWLDLKRIRKVSRECQKHHDYATVQATIRSTIYNTKNSVFWNVTSFSLFKVSRRLGKTCHFHRHG